MRVWRNWQTRQTQDLVLTSAGSSPVTRTIFLGPMVQLVNMSVCHTGDRGFESRWDRHLYAPVVQLDRILDYGSRGWGFESSRACHYNNIYFSGLSSAWQSIWFGTRGSQVRILQSRPFKQVQFNGRTPAFQAGYVGSIPVTCSIFFKSVSLLVRLIFFAFYRAFQLVLVRIPYFFIHL